MTKVIKIKIMKNIYNHEKNNIIVMITILTSNDNNFIGVNNYGR